MSHINALYAHVPKQTQQFDPIVFSPYLCSEGLGPSDPWMAPGSHALGIFSEPTGILSSMSARTLAFLSAKMFQRPLHPLLY